MSSQWCNLNFPLSYVYNMQYLTSSDANLCENSVLIERYLSQISCCIMLVISLVLIFITFFNKTTEDYKYFILHMGFMNLAYGIIYEFFLLLRDTEQVFLMNTITFYSFNIAVSSTFPLGFTRFLISYFPDFYAKIFTKKLIFVWLFVYDLFVTILMFFADFYKIPLLIFGTIFIFMFAIYFCSFLVLLKIRLMMKMVESTMVPNSSTLSDLKRASFVCLFQVFLLTIHLMGLFFSQLFAEILSEYENTFRTFVGAYLRIVPFHTTIYNFIVLMDTLVTLFVLRSYRSLLMEMFKILVKFGKFRFGRISGSQMHYSMAN